MTSAPSKSDVLSIVTVFPLIDKLAPNLLSSGIWINLFSNIFSTTFEFKPDLSCVAIS